MVVWLGEQPDRKIPVGGAKSGGTVADGLAQVGPALVEVLEVDEVVDAPVCWLVVDAVAELAEVESAEVNTVLAPEPEVEVADVEPRLLEAGLLDVPMLEGVPLLLRTDEAPVPVLELPQCPWRRSVESAAPQACPPVSSAVMHPSMVVCGTDAAESDSQHDARVMHSVEGPDDASGVVAVLLAPLHAAAVAAATTRTGIARR